MALKLEQTSSDVGRPRYIPLGWMLDEYGNRVKNYMVWMPYPEKNGKPISQNILIGGIPGGGKSVTAKLIIYYLSKVRPIIDFDWAGEDSYLMARKNSRPANRFGGWTLPPGQKPDRIVGQYMYYPIGSRHRERYEKVIRPNLGKYNHSQLIRLGFSPGAALYLKNIMKKYGPFKSMESFIEFVQKYPVNDNASRIAVKMLQSGKMRLEHNKHYELGDTINTQSRDSILRILPALLEMNIFRLDDKQEYNDFEKHFLEGRNMVFSFNHELIGRAEISYYMERMQEIRKRLRNSPAYFIKVEEAHQIFNQQDDTIERFVTVCRKLSIGILLVMPEVMTVSSIVMDTMKDVITTQFKGKNATKIAESTGDVNNRYLIQHLRLNPYTDVREMMYYSSHQQRLWRFQPFNSPVEIHREA